jgi:anaerobic dimethyl sulfoxide reductase subunit B (iron-sulfur subunit)
MQFGFYFDQSRCTGCYACTIACHDWHDVQDSAVCWRRVTVLEQGSFPDLFVAYVSLSCNHCEHPACARACPAGAISKRASDGIMAVDRQACLGNQVCAMFCKEACPYGVPQFGGEENARMQMCTFCADRLAAGQKPACVAACPMRALDCGPMDELIEKYGNGRTAEGFAYSWATRPSIIIKPRNKG